jgi:hypothetical protein
MEVFCSQDGALGYVICHISGHHPDAVPGAVELKAAISDCFDLSLKF